MRMQVCAGARTEEDKNTGAILKCLVGNVDSLSAACARETGRAARNALQVRVGTKLLGASWLACFQACVPLQGVLLRNVLSTLQPCRAGEEERCITYSCSLQMNMQPSL